MFDANLTKEMGQQAISHPGLVSASYEMDKDLLRMCKKTSALRNQSFSSEENFCKYFPNYDRTVTEFRHRLGQSQPFKFVHDNFGIYANAGRLQREYADAVYVVTCTFLTEHLSNAMEASEGVETSVQVSPKGVFMELRQEGSFDESVLGRIKDQSQEVLSQLEQGRTIRDLIGTMRSSLRRTIGYIPPGLPEDDGRPYRGNGLCNTLLNDFYRNNFVSVNGSIETISIHSITQLENVKKFNSGDRSVIHSIYGPSPLPLSEQMVDDLFAGGFDMKDFFKST